MPPKQALANLNRLRVPSGKTTLSGFSDPLLHRPKASEDLQLPEFSGRARVLPDRRLTPGRIFGPGRIIYLVAEKLSDRSQRFDMVAKDFEHRQHWYCEQGTWQSPEPSPKAQAQEDHDRIECEPASHDERTDKSARRYCQG